MILLDQQHKRVRNQVTRSKMNKNFRTTIAIVLCSVILSSTNDFDGYASAFVAPTTTNTRTSLPQRSIPLTHNYASREEEFDISAQPRSRRDIIGRAAGVLSITMLTSLFMPTAGIAAAVPSKSLSEEYRQGTAALADMDDMAPVPREAYKKLPSGVILADLRPGKSEDGVVKTGSRVNLQWVLRKSNGYFVDSSQVAYGGVPFIFTVGDGTAIAGVDEGVQGMTSGGVRRLLIPPSLAYVDGLDDGKPGPMPVGFGPRQQMRRVQTARKDVPGEYIYLEVQVTRVR
mmetsp:Transcript_8827/g.21561  ORF Transcript_8827/g.21561 Transcript_8827/m.21561 type:complete len:287 (-) Transcript_8827:1469-2329(-)